MDSENPKLVFKFKPHSQFLFRGSVGTAFVAPSLSSINQSDSEGYPWIFDTTACYNELKKEGSFNKIYENLGDISNEKKDDFVKDFLIEQRDVYNQKNLSPELKFVKDFLIGQRDRDVYNQKNLSPELKKELKNLSPELKKELKNLSAILPKKNYCKERQVFTKGEGNKNLKETKALVASLGALWQITEEHSLNLDWWYIKKNGIPSDGLNKKTMDAELKLGKDHVQNYGVTINRDENNANKAMHNGPEHGIQTKLLNLGQTQRSGIDLNWESDMDNFNLSGGSPYFNNQTSYILFAKSEAFPGINIDNIGKFGSPRWRNIATMGWKNERHNFSLKAHTVSSVAKKSSELENLPMYTRFDLDYQFLINEKATLKFGWSNLLFSTPPVDSKASDTKLDHDIFESRGPFFFAGLKYII